MKKPMSVEEWLFKNEKDSVILLEDCMEKYSTYLLNHHLEQFAEECKFYTLQYTDLVPTEDIDQTLNDYLTKNNIV